MGHRRRSGDQHTTKSRQFQSMKKKTEQFKKKKKKKKTGNQKVRTKTRKGLNIQANQGVKSKHVHAIKRA